MHVRRKTLEQINSRLFRQKMIRRSFSKSRIIGLTVFILILSGCAALGTKTVYKSNNLNSYSFNKIGYSQPASEEILNKIRPNTSKLYQVAFEDFFLDKPIKIEKHDLNKLEAIDKADTTEIKKICYENDLDGYICTQIKYKFVNNSYMYIPLGKSEDTYVEMKLYDKNGVPIIHTMHNTSAGNSYMMPPKAEQTIKDGTVGALRQIIKEIRNNSRP